MGIGGFHSPESVPPVRICPPPSQKFVATPLAAPMQSSSQAILRQTPPNSQRNHAAMPATPFPMNLKKITRVLGRKSQGDNMAAPGMSARVIPQLLGNNHANQQ